MESTEKDNVGFLSVLNRNTDDKEDLDFGKLRGFVIQVSLQEKPGWQQYKPGFKFWLDTDSLKGFKDIIYLDRALLSKQGEKAVRGPFVDERNAIKEVFAMAESMFAERLCKGDSQYFIKRLGELEAKEANEKPVIMPEEKPVPLECVKHETAKESGHLSVLEKDKMLKIDQREDLGEGMIKYRYENIYNRQMFVLENWNKEKQCFDMFYINRDFRKKDAQEFVKQFDSQQKLNEKLGRQGKTIMYGDTPRASSRR